MMGLVDALVLGSVVAVLVLALVLARRVLVLMYRRWQNSKRTNVEDLGFAPPPPKVAEPELVDRSSRTAGDEPYSPTEQQDIWRKPPPRQLPAHILALPPGPERDEQEEQWRNQRDQALQTEVSAKHSRARCIHCDELLAPDSGGACSSCGNRS